MKLLISDEIDKYIFEKTRPEPKYLQDLAIETHDEMDMPQMLTGRVAGRFLKMVVQMIQPQLIVEVGTFTGYSALSMAEGLGENGRIITCDVDPKAEKIASKAFKNSPYGDKITLKMGPALDTIASIKEDIDMSFIDADKVNYSNYYELLLEKTRRGGVILIDNTLWSGEVLNPQDESSQAISEVNNTIARDNRVENCLLSVRDGIQLIRKK